MTRVVVITGASDGIGAEMARQLAAREGADVALVLAARGAPLLDTVAGQSRGLAGLVGVPGRTAYCATKFALSGFFDALQVELRESGVSVTTAYPGVVATRIRYRGFNARGEEAGASALKEERAMAVEDCARLILAALDRRQREVVMTVQGKLGRWLRLIAPGVVDCMALNAVKDDLRSQ